MKDLYCERSGSYHEYGLAQSSDVENFQAKLASLEKTWKTTAPGFHEWFLKHQKVHFEEKSDTVSAPEL